MPTSLQATQDKTSKHFKLTKKKALKYFLLGLLMTSIGIWITKENLWIGLIGSVFFGFCSLLFLIKIFKPNFKWVNYTNINSKEFADKSKSDFETLYKNNGIFTYTDTGFIVKTANGDKSINWNQVIKLTGFKRDYFTTDCICLVVECDNDFSFEVTEEHLGWFQFLEHSKNVFPTIDKSWEIEISTPAFETNLTVLFDRENQKLKKIDL